MNPVNQASGADVATLEDYLDAIRRRKLLVFMFALGTALLVWALAASRTPTYEASATILVGPTPVGSTDGARLAQPNLERIKSVISSVDNVESATESLNLSNGPDPSDIIRNTEIVYVPASDVLTVSYRSTDPDDAARWANSISAAFVETRESEAAGFYSALVESNQSQLETGNADIQSIDEQISSAQSELARLKLEPTDNATRIGEVEALLSSLRLDRAEVNIANRSYTAAMGKAQAAQKVRPTAAALLRNATPPEAATQISARRLAAGGAIFGLLLGVVMAFFLSRLDRRLKTDAEIESTLLAPVLASIPHIPRRHRNDGAAVVMATTSKSIAARRAQEEFRRLRSSVVFATKRDNTSVFLVTSTRPGEGKSTVVMNLGLALAKAGMQTAVISADLRRPSLDKLMGLGTIGQKGLSDWLSGDDSVPLARETGIDGLTLIPSGTLPGNPTELLTSKRTSQLFEEVRESFDIILVDTPPVLSTADAGALIPFVDHVLIVVDTHKIDTDDLFRTRELLMQVGAKIVGAANNQKRMTFLQRFGRGRDAYLYDASQIELGTGSAGELDRSSPVVSEP